MEDHSTPFFSAVPTTSANKPTVAHMEEYSV